jgi:hypothetical protein
MSWEVVEYTDEFGVWWETLTDQEQGDVAAYVGELERRGPMLRTRIRATSKIPNMGQCGSWVQSGGKPIRVFYVFDPRRKAILLIGGRKAGVKRFYEQFVPIADRLYDEHLAELRAEDKKEPKHGGTTSVQGASGQDVPDSAKPRRGKN